ncbi:MAG TPA: hypothetical protein VFU02_21335 [Polyangiaceae bacterium]|nr:hypothetical protein [Polyangiaceae bacterium]
MTSRITESYEARALRLGRATRELAPSPGFHARVLAAIVREPVGWWSAVTPLAGRVLPILAVLAVLATAAAWHAASGTEQALAVPYGSVEVEW